jgi:microcystin-dependent protein
MSQPFIGQVEIFGGNFAPRQWAFCQGQLLSIAQNTALFSILGTTYGGDGRTTFGLPDLRGRAAIHPGTGPGLPTYVLGQKGGVTNATLNLNQVASHSHAGGQLKASAGAADTTNPAGNSLAMPPSSGNLYKAKIDPPGTDVPPSDVMHTDSVGGPVGAVGGGQSHENRSPYLAMNFIIAIQGVFPSRN